MSQKKDKENIENYIDELKEITNRLENDDIKLKDAVDLYKQGAIAAAKAEKMLDELEQELQIIDTTDFEEE